MIDDEIESEGEEGEDEDFYEPRSFGMCDGDTYVPDTDLLTDALDKLGVVPLAFQLRDGQVFVLIASSAGFKWSDIESVGKSDRKLKSVQ